MNHTLSKKITPISSLFLISALVGLYQISLVQQKLNQYGLDNHLSTVLPYGMNAQNFVEDAKISLENFEFKTSPVAQVTTPAIVEAAPVINTPTEVINTPQPDSTPPVVQAPSKCVEKCKVLMLGDSVMGDVYFSLSRKIGKLHPDWKIIDAHKVSSGLSKPSYYNWIEVSHKLVNEIKPDYTFILIGMNDAQSIEDGNKAYFFNSNAWKDTYTQKTQTIFSTINYNDNSTWIELPPVKENAFDKRLSVIRGIHQQIANTHYLLTEDLIGNNKNKDFSKYRQNDGIHLNATGADVIANDIVNKIFKNG